MKLLTITFAVAAPALAQVETFEFEFEFLNALDDAKLITETFESFPIDTVIAPGTSANGVTYDAFPSASGGLVGDDFFNLDFQALYLERDGAKGQGPTDYFFPGDAFTVTFEQPVFAVGAFFNVGDSVVVTDYVFINTPVGAASSGGVLPDPSGMFFVGLISDIPFTTATFGSTAEAPTGWNFDNMHRAPAGDIIVYQFHLDTCQEVADVATTGHGDATVILNTDTNTVTVDGTYADMGSEVSMAHIHGLADDGQNAGVILGLTVDGGLDGTFSGEGELTDEQVQGMLDGLTYINVHTFKHPGGEVRGQVENQCRADVNRDGVKNILDFVAYQQAFVAEVCEADVNHDLIYNILDFVAFQTLFQQPCD